MVRLPWIMLGGAWMSSQTISWAFVSGVAGGNWPSTGQPKVLGRLVEKGNDLPDIGDFDQFVMSLEGWWETLKPTGGEGEGRPDLSHEDAVRQVATWDRGKRWYPLRRAGPGTSQGLMAGLYYWGVKVKGNDERWGKMITDVRWVFQVLVRMNEVEMKGRGAISYT